MTFSDAFSEAPTPGFLDSLVELDESIRLRDPTESCSTLAFGDELLRAHRLLFNLQDLFRPAEATRNALPPGIPDRMGRYQLLEVLGAGGFAVVYLAEDRYLGRHAAVKIPRSHALASADLRQRFVREAKAAALLDHPNIVATYEAGEEAEVPYIAYAYCEGSTLSAWIKRRAVPLEPKVAAAVLRTLADATQYSHERGILHRDIKPANVLLQPHRHHDSGPFPFVAKLSDFGLAKLMDVELQDTVTGVMLGTPRYMAPEQTSTRGAPIGPATDVYGLGCVLYELLTGQPPFTAETPWDVLTQVREYPPAAPRLIRPQIPRDLEIIVLTCLAKAPADRYATAGDLSDDLERFLDGSPIRARPVPLSRQLWLWCQHHRAIASLSMVAFAMGMLIVVGLLAYIVQVTELDNELTVKNQRLTEAVMLLDTAVASGATSRELAENHAVELSRILYTINVARAADAWKNGDVQAMAASLESFTQSVPGEGDQREFSWRYLWRQKSPRELFRTTLPTHQFAACFAPDGLSVAFAGADSVVRQYSLKDFQLIRQFSTEQKEINSLVFGPAGDWMATAGDDGTVAVWNLSNGTRRHHWPVFSGHIAYQVAFDAARNLLVVCGNVPDVQLLDFSSGKRVGTLSGGHTKGVEALVLSPDGRQVLTCGADEKVIIWDLETREVRHRLGGFKYFASSGAWSPDGRYVVAGSLDCWLRMWDAESGALLAERQLLDPVQSVAITTDGLVLAGDRAGTVTAFRLEPRPPAIPRELVPVARWPLHKHRVYGLATTAVAGLVATASRDQDVAVFEPQITPAVIHEDAIIPDGNLTTSRIVGPDLQGRRFRIARKGIEVIAADGTKIVRTLAATNSFRDLSWKYDTLAAAEASGRLFLWNTSAELSEGENIDVYSGDAVGRILPLDRQRIFLQQAFRNRGQVGVGLWNLKSRSFERFWLERHNVAVSTDGKYFVLADNKQHGLSLLDAATCEVICTSQGHTESINDIAFGRTGQRIYTASTDRTVRVWDAVTLRELLWLRGHGAQVRSLAVSPDEKTLASCDDFGSLRLWDLRSGRELYELYRHHSVLKYLEFNADGDELRGLDGDLAEFRWSCRDPTPP